MTLTLQQIAQLAGVSRSTASRVINEHPDVSPAARERVWQVIGEYGYRPNPIARLLAASRTGESGADQPVKESSA